MSSFLALMLLFAAFYGRVLCVLNLDQLCDLSDPSHRTSLLESVTQQLQKTYNINDGFAMFGTCDPKDPNMHPGCANYNNPSLAYGSSLVPCPDGTCPPETPPTLPGKSGYYQPKQDNALILFGCLPPETAYFGIRTYLYEKGKANVPEDLNCTGALNSLSGKDVEVFPPDPTVPGSRVVVDTPWYDTTNQLNVNAVGKPGSKTKFRSLFVHVTTANKRVARDITKAFIKSGVPKEAINIDSIPDIPLFHLEGETSLRDSFRTIYRLVLPDSFLSDEPPSPAGEEMNKYISFSNRNILVRYLTPKSTIPKKGFLPKNPTPRQTGETEQDVVGKDTFERLLSQVKNHYGSPDYVANPIPFTANLNKCLQGCYGFGVNLDTVYINTDHTVTIAKPNDFAVVCGADHLVLGYALYTSVGVFNTTGLAVGLVNDDMKVNSARCFMPSLPNIDKLYCVEIRSDCKKRAYCVEPIFKDVKSVLVQYRINLNPNTKTGPDPSEVIWPMIYGYRKNFKQFPSC